jgi:hypothetical protein
LQNCRDVLTEICTCGCQGTGGFKEKALDNVSLDALKKYEKEMNMAGKKDDCGCGCVGKKQESTKATTQKNKPKKSR